MRKMFVAIVALGLLVSTARAQAQYYEEDNTYTESRGFLGGLLGVGIGVNGQIDSGRRAWVDTSATFALRGGILMGEEHRGTLTFEVAPVTTKLDWTLQPTATGIVSGGKLVQIRKDKAWAWHWEVGVGFGGGLDYRFMVGAKLDILSFNYKWNEKVWVDFGIPTLRFYIELANQARYNTQIIFPLGITWAI